MSRRLHPCVRCGDQPEEPTRQHPFTLRRGLTRHADGICSACRRGVPTTAASEQMLRAYRGRAA